MANKYDDQVEIILADGKTRHLKFGMNGRASFQSEMGFPILSLFLRLQKGVADAKSPEEQTVLTGEIFGDLEIRALLWAGLLHESPRLTILQVGNMIQDLENRDGTVKTYALIFKKVLEAWSYAQRGTQDPNPETPPMEEGKS